MDNGFSKTKKAKDTNESFRNVTLCILSFIMDVRNRTMEYHINKIQKGASKLAYNDTLDLRFDELLVKDILVSIHSRNLQLLATEIFKAKDGIATELTSEVYQFVKKPYNLRDICILYKRGQKWCIMVVRLFLH